MPIIEEVNTDARNADGYVVLFRIEKPLLTGVLAVPATIPTAASLRKLTKAISSHSSLSVQLEGYQTERRQTKAGGGIYEIKSAVRVGMERVIDEFLEYAKQARVIKNPIICDMRDFKP